MKADTRQNFLYRGKMVLKTEGSSRYFGCRHGCYLRRWWKILFGDGTWIFVGTKAEARTYIDKWMSRNLTLGKELHP